MAIRMPHCTEHVGRLHTGNSNSEVPTIAFLDEQDTRAVSVKAYPDGPSTKGEAPMPRNAHRRVSGKVRRHSTRFVDRRSTEPRVGSSNLSGRANLSRNTRHAEFFAACDAAGLNRASAGRLLAAFADSARLAASGSISTRVAVTRARAMARAALRSRKAVAS